MKKVLAIALLALTLALVNCKDKGTTDPTPTKTLNKSLMVNKYWKTTTGIPLDNYFRSDGKICSSDGQMVFGTWAWLNNSDSLEKVDATLGRSVWYVGYCTETEMALGFKRNNKEFVFTKQ